MIRAIILCIILSTLNPAIAASPSPQREVTIQSWLRHVKVCADKYGVDPYFALAVAEVESSGRGQRFRFGKVGKYWLPMGIHQCFEKRWNLANIYVNTEVGIRALARHKSQRHSLHRYNTSFNEAYYRRIKQLEAKNRREGVFNQ